MRENLTFRQQQILDYICEFQAETGMAPTRAEIALRMGYRSKNAASDHLRALARKGYINLHSDRSRGIQVLVDTSEDNYELPVIGQVAAGSPIEAVENIERSVPVPEGLFKRRPTYLLRVRGESMRDLGILDGDLIAVHRTQVANSGDIVVARINNEVTVKTLKLMKDKAALLPANNDFQPIIVPAAELVIEGTFVGLIRDHF